MALPNKPTIKNVWATSGLKVEPSDAKVDTGWIVERPPHQFQNYLQNRSDQFLKHINEAGIPVWDAVTVYTANKSYAQGSDGKIYKALTSGFNQNPVGNPTNWMQTIGDLDVIEYTEQAQDAAAAAQISEDNAEAAEATAISTLAVFSDTPPASPLSGRRWTSSINGKTYEWIVDVDGGQWVETGSAVVMASTALLAALAAVTGATLVGTPTGTVQAAINDRAVSSDLSAATGATLVGVSGGGTVQSAITARPTSASLAAAGGAALVGTTTGTVQSDIVAIKSTTKRVVDSLTELRALSKLVYATAFATGTTTKGDGGGGAYYYDSTDTTSADNGGTVIVATDGGRWKRINSGRQSGQFYTEYGALVEKFGDRVFVGGAAANAGDNVTVQADWLTTYQIAKGRTNGFIQSAQVAMLNSTHVNNQNAGNSLVVGAQTKYLYDGYNAIGIIAIGVANKTSGAGHAYAGYFEAYRDSGATGGAYSIEVDAMNYAGLAATDPYQQATGQVIGLQIAAGGELSAVGQFDVSAAINIRKNVGSTFTRGIVFGSDSLTGANGTTGTAEAVVMGIGHKLAWYAGAGVATSAIYSVATTTLESIEQRFTNSAVNFRNVNNSKPVFQISAPSSGVGVNYISAQAAIAGGAPALATAGDDTNIDLQLKPRGTGVLWFGTYTAGAVTQAGYITVKDSGGTIRRLLVG
jgi:hypothetical protein